MVNNLESPRSLSYLCRPAENGETDDSEEWHVDDVEDLNLIMASGHCQTFREIVIFPS